MVTSKTKGTLAIDRVYQEDSGKSELTQDFPVTRFVNGVGCAGSISLARETPYTLFVNDEEILSISTLPIRLEELFTGFLVSEGVLLDPLEILGTMVDRAARIVSIDLDVPEDRLERIKKKGMLTSGCAGGIMFSVETSVRPESDFLPKIVIPADVISKRMKEVDLFKGVYSVSRGTHASSVASLSENIIILEDIGRHNAIDKIVGYCFLNQIKPHDKILLTTGRITSEAVSKASRFRFPIIVSRSSASSTAINMASRAHLDVVTYARAGRFNLFNHGATQIVPSSENQ